jgi:hypothetical protein
MQKQLGKIGTVRRNIYRNACPFCGGCKYQLILCTSGAEEDCGLSAWCSQCHRPGSFDENFGPVMWM